MSKTILSPGHAVVIGAGVVGLGTAWALARDGWQVTVIDRDQPGAGASGGNGAQLSYSYVQPLADPAIWTQLPKLLLSPESPLRFRLRADPAQWSWLLRFMAACRSSVSRETTAQLLTLAARSRQVFEQMLQEEGLDCDFSRSGKLVLYPDASGLESARRQVQLQQAMGGESQRILTASECVGVEPALAHHARRIAGGVFTPSECAVDAAALCQDLQQRLADQGVRFMLGQPVQAWRQSEGRVYAVSVAGQEVQADAFVLAAGTGSASLARQLGMRLPVYPLKGYSITVPVPAAGGDSAAPRVSITDLSRKVVFARLGERIRVAGMVEVVGEDRGIDTRRIESLKATTRHVFPEIALDGPLNPWAGLRPATPRGLPIIGRRPGMPDRVWLNTGHGALGLTLAMGSAVRIRDLLRETASGPAARRLPAPAACSA
ncbi:D-amino acid dehydrogenase [Hydrogenophaga sp.]|uniref:D-amino acid dehydrogenase n=1 Tax=Hydrogenophaga sp. TaxID=1904254 RepID=UPI002BDFC0E2|nr:D-amino acid dehydrogenase [Hydrogenophaga sp.]HMP09144.1 D-amino acid dehydrogenase [Hydrogenophaga sp.]